MPSFFKKESKPRAKKRPARTERKRLVAALDKLASEYVRIRDKRANNGLCVFGCGKPIQSAFHVVTRAKFSIRWDVERNLFGSDVGCNLSMEYNPGPFIVWYIRRFGAEAYEKLVLDGNEIAHFDNDELRAMLEALKVKMETVCLNPLPSLPPSKNSSVTDTATGPSPLT